MAKPKRTSTISSSSSSSSWADLPSSLLFTILSLLPSIRDLASFSSVCRSWRLSSSSHSSSSLFAPLLLFPLRSGQTRRPFTPRVSTLRFYDPAGPPLSYYPLSKAAVKCFSYRILGCSHGRLIYLLCDRVVVLNPFDGSQLVSPRLTMKIDSASSVSCVLTARPFSCDSSSVLIFSCGSFIQWRIGSSEWSDFGSAYKLSDVRLVAVNGQLYAIDSCWRLKVTDLCPSVSWKDLQVDLLCEKINFSLIDWFVDLGGKLLFLQFEPGEEIMKARSTAFLLENSSWVKMESLGNWAIFVCPNPSFTCVACENPERWGGRKNCIYFAKSNGDGINGVWAEIEHGEEIDISEPDSPLYRGNLAQRPAPLWIYPSN